MLLSVDLALLEATLLLVMGAALVVLGGAFLLRRQGIDPWSAGLLMTSGFYVLLWKEPQLVGFQEGEFLHIELAQPVFLLLLSASLFHWAVWLFQRHVDALESTTERISSLLSVEEALLDILRHDLRNPLAVASGNVELIASEHPELTSRTSEIENSLARARKVLDDSVVYAELARGGQPGTKRLDLVAVTRGAIEALDAVAGRQGVEVDLSAPDELACHASPLIRHAIENALHNAIKWSPRDARVTVVLEDTEGAARIRVVDHGPGMPEKDQARLFGRFEQGPATNGEGLGLGLAIVARLTEMHGGTLSITETVGGGCTLEIVLPRPAIAETGPAQLAGLPTSVPKGGGT